MTTAGKREADGLVHSKPGSVDQQNEDSFPASDAPTFSPGAIGAPGARRTPPLAGGTLAPEEPTLRDKKNKGTADKKSPA